MTTFIQKVWKYQFPISRAGSYQITLSITLWRGMKQVNENHINKAFMSYLGATYLFTTFWTPP